MTEDLPALPRSARLSINRCNYPPSIVGGLTFQREPSPLQLDAVFPFHRQLFEEHLPALATARDRAQRFLDYMEVSFRLHCPEELGWDAAGPKKRVNATYYRFLRGWSLDSNGREGAVLKAWVESRFGLRPTFHREPLRDEESEAYRRYELDRAQGLFATNALEAQFDLLYTYCQYEMALSHEEEHLTLYRGVTRVEEEDRLGRGANRMEVILLNNLSSFTSERERSEEFGHLILEARVPRSKIFFHNRLLPKLLTGEDEYLVIGGLYEVNLCRM